jgi:hypothetical protein
MARARSAAFWALMAPLDNSPGASFLFLQNRRHPNNGSADFHSVYTFIALPSSFLHHEFDLGRTYRLAILFSDLFLDLCFQSIARFTLDE